MSGFFVLIIMGSTDKRASAGFFGLTIGVALTVIHLVSIPVTNTSVNPARSTGPAIVQSLMSAQDGWALGQLWLFWVAPIIGGIIGGLVYHFIWGQKDAATA
ncbi:MAG TPA: aquaporin [Rudaea sp.]